MPPDNPSAPKELFVFFGLIASGKSTLAQAWAVRQHLSYYNSDRLRKELAGLAPACNREESFGKGIYTREFSVKTYTALLKRAELELGRGKSVVLDGSYQERRERDLVRGLARRLGCRLYFVLCVCPEDEMRRRMDIRARDPQAVSDGRWEIYLQQKQRFEPPTELAADELLRILTLSPVEKLVERMAAMISAL